MTSFALGPDDPINQYVRYPIARAFVRAIGSLPVRPNHLTAAALLVGFGAAYLVWRGAWIAAFALLEVRMILDCADGEVARTKNLSSASGRMFDELGDAASYLAFVGGIGLRLHDWKIPLGLLVIGTLCALGHDWYKRRGWEAPPKSGFGAGFARIQRVLFPPRPIRPFLTAILSWDLGLTILHVGVLTSHVYEASIAAMAFGLPPLILSRSIKQ